MTFWPGRDNVIYCRFLTSQVTGLSRPRRAPGPAIGDVREPVHTARSLGTLRPRPPLSSPDASRRRSGQERPVYAAAGFR
jgi:hypothetical protein